MSKVDYRNYMRTPRSAAAGSGGGGSGVDVNNYLRKPGGVVAVEDETVSESALPAAPDDFLSQSAEVGRAVTRGVQDTFEFVGDAADLVPPVRMLLGGIEGYQESDPNASFGDQLGAAFKGAKDEAFNWTGESAGDRLRGRAFGAQNETARQLTAEQYRRGDNAWLDRAKGAGRFIGGAATGGGLLGKGARIATGLGVLGGTAAGTAADALDATPETAENAELWGQMGGSLATSVPALYGLARKGVNAVGGGAADFASRLRRMFDVDTPSAPVMRNVTQDVVDLATPQGAQSMSAEARRAQVLRQLDDTAAEAGPLSARLDSPPLRSAERNVVQQAALGGDKEQILGDLNRARIAAGDQAMGTVSEIAPMGSPNRARDVQRAALDRTVAGIDDTERAGIAAADQAAEAERLAARERVGASTRGMYRDTQDALKPYPAVDDAATRVSDELANRVSEAQAASKAAWARVKPGSGAVTKMKVRRAIQAGIRAAMPDDRLAQELFMERQGSKLLSYLDRFDGNRISAPDVNRLKTLIRDEIKAEAPKSGQKVTNAIAASVGNKLLDVIDNARGTQTLRKAIATSRDEFALNSGPLRKARKAAGSAGARVEAEKLTRPGQSGESIADMVSKRNDPDGLIRESLTDAYRAQFKQVFKGNPKNVSKARTWMQNRAPALKLLGLQDELARPVDRISGVPIMKDALKTELAAAKVTRKEALSRTKAAAKAARKDAAKSPVAKFTTEADSYKAAQTALKSKTAQTDTAELMRTAKAAGKQSVDDVKAAFREAILESNTKASTRVRGQRVWGNSALDYIKNNRAALSEVFDADELAKIEKGFDQVSRNLAGSSITIDPASTVRETGVLNWLKLLGARVGGAGLITGVFKLPSLIAANTATREATRVFKNLPDTQYRRAMAKFLADPEALRDAITAVEKTTDKRAAGKALGTLMRKFAESGGAAIGAAAQMNED